MALSVGDDKGGRGTSSEVISYWSESGEGIPLQRRQDGG